MHYCYINNCYSVSNCHAFESKADSGSVHCTLPIGGRTVLGGGGGEGGSTSV